MATFTTNTAGEFLVDANGSDAWPEGLEYSADKKIILRGYVSAPIPEVMFMLSTVQHGKIFGTRAAIRGRRCIAEGVLRCAAAVVFVRKPGCSKYYVVLSKSKSRRDPAHPCVQCYSGETGKEAAIRETKAETGLDLMDIKPLAVWESKDTFEELEWTVNTTGFYGFAECPDDWVFHEPVTKIGYENGDIEYVVVAEVSKIPNLDISEIDRDLVYEAWKRMNVPRGLTSFEWVF